MSAIIFEVPGRCVPCPRPRVRRGFTPYYPRRYTDWLASARQSLVTHPGEEELFQIYESGWYSPASRSEWGISQRFFNFLFGGGEDIRGCVELYALTIDELR